MNEPSMWWTEGTKEKTLNVYGTLHYPVCTYAHSGSGACTCRDIDKDKQVAQLQAENTRLEEQWAKVTSWWHMEPTTTAEAITNRCAELNVDWAETLSDRDAAREEVARLQGEVERLTGPFPDARSNWTKDQWRQLALLARHRAEKAEGEVEQLTQYKEFFDVATDKSGFQWDVLMAAVKGVHDRAEAAESSLEQVRAALEQAKDALKRALIDTSGTTRIQVVDALNHARNTLALTAINPLPPEQDTQ